MMIEILGASAPAWANEEQSAISLEVRFSHQPGVVLPFCATHNDTDKHGRELFSRAKFGEYGPISPYAGPTKEDLDTQAFHRKKAKAADTAERMIAPLERAKRLGLATPEEEAELDRLERYSVYLLRAKGPELFAMSDM